MGVNLEPGQKIHNLTVLRKLEERRNGYVMYEFKCDCGNTTKLRGAYVTIGKTRSCGCLTGGNIDITGQKKHKLTAIKRVPKRGNQGQQYWEFQCDCGNKHIMAKMHFGGVKSCGCVLLDDPFNSTTHGDTGTSLHNRWFGIKSRCYNENHSRYKDYGGRGIKMWKHWIKDYARFKRYVETLPRYGEPGLDIDRINNNDHYRPGNIRWATRSENCYNRGQGPIDWTFSGTW